MARGPSGKYLSTARGQEYHRRAFNFLAAERRGLSREAAQEQFGITPRTVRRHLPGAYQRKGRRVVPKRSDRLRRPPMRVLTPTGEIWMEPAGSKDASNIGRHWSVIGRLAGDYDEDVREGALDELTDLMHVSVTGYDADTGKRIEAQLETNPVGIDRLARQGELTMDDGPYVKPRRR
jgi:predicted transcriptional regulator